MAKLFSDLSTEERLLFSYRRSYACQALAIVKTICNEHGINYLLLAGSCLGAVRNQGMIPWDEDIDIGFQLSDYEEFRKVAIVEFPKHGFEFRDWRSTSPIPRRYGKVIRDGQGLVDCFRLVPFPDGEVKQKIVWAKRKLLNAVFIRKVGYTVIDGQEKLSTKLKSLALLPLKTFLSRERVEKLMDDLENETIESPYLINLYSVYPMKKEILQRDWVHSTIDVLFEGDSYPIPNDYNAYLSNIYGDYMTPPPEDKQFVQHLWNIY